MASIHVFLSILSQSNLSFCCFRIAHAFHSGYKWTKTGDWNFSYGLKSVHVKDGEFYKDITMEKNNRKKYIHIGHEMSSNEIFEMLGKIEDESESEFESYSEDFDTKHIEQ